MLKPVLFLVWKNMDIAGAKEPGIVCNENYKWGSDSEPIFQFKMSQYQYCVHVENFET